MSLSARGPRSVGRETCYSGATPPPTAEPLGPWGLTMLNQMEVGVESGNRHLSEGRRE